MKGDSKMFNSSNPPLLVQFANTQQITVFSQHEGYNIHFLSADKSLVSYREGWTFPLSVHQRNYITDPPLLMVKNKGRLTTSGSTFNKGYAHQFCDENGREPDALYQMEIFPDQPGVKWMLVKNTVVMIWLQYGNKNQYCGDSSFDMERIYYGKLIIRKFVIEEDYAPRLDKEADNTDSCSKQYRIDSHDLYNESWNTSTKEPETVLQELLADKNLERFAPAVMTALKKANTPL